MKHSGLNLNSRSSSARPLRIGFISTRFAGTDGVSLEVDKWVHVFEKMGHSCFYFAGLCDKPAEKSMIIPEAFYRHPDVQVVHDRFFSSEHRDPKDTKWVHQQRAYFHRHLRRFIDEFSLDLLIPENVLTIPLQIPLALAITELVAETGIPTIAHHHDFAWERKRFFVNSIRDYLRMAFPPNLPSIQHAVINSIAQQQLALRCGIGSSIIPNVMDYDHCEVALDSYADDLRERLGIAPNELFVLQPTRIIARKGIEHAIELVGRLGRPAKLVISHASGDEGDAYSLRIRDYAALLGVPLIFAPELVAPERELSSSGQKIYSLADFYHQCDLVTYPSIYEGFGNAFLEGAFYHKPMVVQNYTVYAVDIKPKGFRCIEFDEYITDHTISQTLAVLDDAKLFREMCEMNFAIARRYFSFRTLQYQLATLLGNAFGPSYALLPPEL